SGPGAAVAAAVLEERQGDFAAADVAFERAAREYAAAGRALDAHRVRILRFFRESERSGSPEREAALRAMRASAEREFGPVDVAEIALMLGDELYSRDYAEGLAHFERARELLLPQRPCRALADALYGIAKSRRRAGDLGGAAASYEEAASLARRLPVPATEIRALRGIAIVRRDLGEYDASAAAFESLLAKCRDTGNLRELQRAQGSYRSVLRALGRYREARDLAEERLRICRELDLTNDLPYALDSYGGEEALLGRLQEAQSLFAQALTLADRPGSRNAMVFPLVHLVDVSIDLGDLDTAERHLRAGLEVAAEVGHATGERLLHRLEIRLLEQRDRHADVLAALDATEEPGLTVAERWSRSRMRARALAALGRVPAALAVLDSTAARLYDGTTDRFEYGYSQEARALILTNAGRFDEAVAAAEEAVAIAAEAGAGAGLAMSHRLAGQSLAAAGRSQEAVPHLAQAVEWVERTNRALTLGDQRAEHLARWYGTYVSLASVLADVGRAEEAFRVFEASRARELRRLFGSAAPGLHGRVPASFASELERTELDLALQEAVLERTTPDDPHRAELRAVVDSLDARRAALREELGRLAPEYAREIGVATAISATAARERLGPGDLLLAFMVGGAETLVFELKADTLDVRRVPLDRTELGELVGALAESVRAGNSEEWREHAAEIADRLFGAKAWRSAPPARLAVVPDGPLHHLPFDLLPVADGRLLLETSEIVQGASATLLLEPRPRAVRHDGTSPLLAFGDPTAPDSTWGALPWARREVEGLRETFPAARVYTGASATESRVYREAPEASVLHLAAHAWADPDAPRRSGVVLAPDGATPEHDGFLHAFEVLEQSFPQDLVTLSGCETGRGAWVSGEGLLGLSRAFQIAGARSIVVSLWDVDDAATADFMARFYRRWTGGSPLATALREAKLEFFRERDEVVTSGGEARGVRRVPAAGPRHPRYWAPFVLLADESAFGRSPGDGAR
ncbi:MAG: CHAT domain-containing protein, partial [Gemmatimonadetes bacterium]|nr:CHAT domain-containing protein [Gemmatimonadota bacterium]